MGPWHRVASPQPVSTATELKGREWRGPRDPILPSPLAPPAAAPVTWLPSLEAPKLRLLVCSAVVLPQLECSRSCCPDEALLRDTRQGV